MKKLYTVLFSVLVFNYPVLADTYIISIDGFEYTPATISVEVGDVITIEATPNHPLVQVSEDTWMANGNTQLIGGFGPETSEYTFTVTNADDIYFVCSNHVSTGMKGLIEVVNTTSIAEAAQMTSLDVYPNPITNGEFTVKAAHQLDGQQLAFYNTQGQLMQTITVNGMQTQVALSLADGVYTAVLFENGEAVARKRLMFVSQ